MIIESINIKSFGMITDLSLNFSNEINVIIGQNEAGKSTIAAFIKFMLYGLTRRNAQNSERERSVNWSTHRAAGSMTFVCDGKQYRIERSFSEATRGGSEKLSIICLDDGSSINTDKTPGEFFLGVPREAFESSACIGQMRSADINGEKVAASIENMLSSADESVDTAKILKTLDAVRVEYRHKNRSGGSLYEDEQKMNQLRLRAEKAREASLSLEGWEQKLAENKRDKEIVERDFEHKDALLGELNKVTVIKRFEALRETQKELDGLTQKIEACERELNCDGFMPDKAHTAEIKLSAKGFAEAQKLIEQKRSQRPLQDSEDHDEGLVRIARKLADVGGKDAVMRELGALQKKAKNQGVLCIAMALLALLFAIGGAVLLVFMGIYGACGFAACLVPLIIIAVAANKRRAARTSAVALCGEYESTPESLGAKLDACLAELAKADEYGARMAKLDSELEYARRELEAKKEALAAILKKTAKNSEATIEFAASEYKRLEALIAEREELLRRRDALGMVISAEKSALGHYDEDALRGEVTVSLDEVTPRTIAEAERQRSFLSQKLKAFADRIYGIENTVVGLRATAEDPLPIYDELASLEKKHKTDSEFYDALTLAMESIESAAGAMRGNVTPVISKQAGEFLDSLTDGKYSVMRTTGTLGVSLDRDGYSLKPELLSAGTRDVAYIALRLSLFMRIFKGELPPLVLDESLAQLDENRAQKVIALLDGFAKDGVQTLLFTSHKREGEILDSLALEYNAITL